ncbi:MAG: GIY-YIG nuclease family protein [Kiritimatiellales bacterium]|nr:GIY-YIG nuclease family protein [Kiritimatiellales bacterium]
MPYHFYLARCSDNSLYSGYCKDISDRENAHNAGKGAKYTRARRPVKIIHSEEFQTQSEAMKRESEIKKWSKNKKEQLVTKSPNH